MIIDIDKQPKIRIKAGWDQEGRTGILLGVIVNIHGIDWAPVLWDFTDDPDWQKASSLEGLVERWESLRT